MSIVELISMKNRFTKIILIILVISIIPMLSGFCIFRLSSINLIKIDVAQAAGVDHNINNILIVFFIILFHLSYPNFQ